MADGPAPATIAPTPVIDLPRAGGGSAARKAPAQPAPPPEPIEPVGTHGAGESADQLMPGLIRDERGVWIAPETED